jgi:glyoxylase-like metal-dependent hydrolase (beta-lactamase superfamily II)
MKIPIYLDAIRIPFTVPAPGGAIARFVHAFLIKGPEITVVDTGVAGAERDILAQVAQRGRRSDEVGWILLTHSHPDHVGAARPLRDATGGRVAVHSAERRWVEDTAAQARERPVPGFDRLVAGSVPVARTLEDGDVLDLDRGRTIRVLHTPGHSPGSVTLLLEPDGVAFCGDAVPIPGEMPIYEDPVEVVRSLERLRERDVGLLLSAWDEPQDARGARRRIGEGIVWIQRIDDAVRQASRGLAGLDSMALCREVVRSLDLPPPSANPLVARSLESHLRTDAQR